MRRLLDAARVGHLGTVDREGRPHVVPACFVLVGDVVYSAVDDKPKRSAKLRRLANIEATGLACLLVDEYDEDWTRLWWVRLDGLGRIVAGDDERTSAVAALKG